MRFDGTISILMDADKDTIHLQISKCIHSYEEEGIVLAPILQPTGSLSEYRRIEWHKFSKIMG
jgi:hypothetical protein